MWLEDSKVLQSEGENELKTIIKKVKVILMTTIYLQPKYSLKAEVKMG